MSPIVGVGGAGGGGLPSPAQAIPVGEGPTRGGGDASESLREFAESRVLTDSGIITEKACIVLSFQLSLSVASSLLVMSLREGTTASGRLRWQALLNARGSGPLHPFRKGLLFRNGVYFDKTGSSAVSWSVNLEYVEIDWLPIARGRGEKNTDNVLGPAPPRSSIFRDGSGTGGGGGGGGGGPASAGSAGGTGAGGIS